MFTLHKEHARMIPRPLHPTPKLMMMEIKKRISTLVSKRGNGKGKGKASALNPELERIIEDNSLQSVCTVQGRASHPQPSLISFPSAQRVFGG